MPEWFQAIYDHVVKHSAFYGTVIGIFALLFAYLELRKRKTTINLN